MEEDISQNRTEIPGQPQITHRKKPKKWLYVLGIVIAILAVLIFMGARALQGAIQAADGYIADMQAGRCTQIYDRATEAFQKQGTRDEWVEVCTGVSNILTGEPRNLGVDVESNSSQNQVSTVTYEIDGTDSVTYIVLIGMVNQDDQWKISLFDSDPKEDQ